MITSLLLWGIAGLLRSPAPAQDLSRKLDYTTVAVPLRKALEDLSGQAGARLRPSDELADEIIVLRLKGVAADEAMKRIAGTMGAEWKKVDGGFDLERPPALEAKLKEQGLQARAAAVKKLIDEQIKSSEIGQIANENDADRLAARFDEAAKQEQSDINAFQTVRRIQESAPEQRAVWKVLALIDPREIAGMESGQRLVFSNEPTASQLPISGDLSAVGREMQKQQNLLAAAFRKLLKDAKNPPYVSGAPPWQTVPGPPVRFVVSLQLIFLSQSYDIRMIGFDSANNPLVVCYASLDVIRDFEGMMAQRARVAKETASEPDIPVSPISQKMLDFMRSSMGGGGDAAKMADGDLKAALINPDKVDPLAYLYSEAFLGIASLRNENLVAYPDDSAFLLGMFAGMEGRLKPSLVMQTVTGLGPMVPTNVTESDGWISVAPLVVPEASRTRSSRPMLGEFMRTYDERGYLSLDAVAKLATSVSLREFPALDLFLPLMIDEKAQLDQVGDFNLLKLYGSLDEGQIRRLSSKQAIRLVELRPEQSALVNRYVYESQFSNQHTRMSGDLRPVVDNEPTEVMPDGLPNDTTLTMSFQDTPVYFVKQSIKGSTYTSAMNISTLAWTVSQKVHQGNPESVPTVLSIQPGVQRSIQFVVRASERQVFQSEMKEQSPAQGGPWTLETMPDDVKKELAKQVDMYSHLPGRPGDSNEPPAPKAPPPPV